MVAVSGGPDSVALLDLLHTLAPDLGLSLVVAHADHGIQADSGTVRQAVAALTLRYGLPFELGELRLGSEASETAARRARYAWLAEVQRHHAARDRLFVEDNPLELTPAGLLEARRAW